MKLLFFAIGFLACVFLFCIFNFPYLRKLRRKRKTEIEKNPDKKITTTKVVLFSILFTYYAAFALGMYVVLLKDTAELANLLTFVGGATVFAVAFYCWKAKCENLEKIKNRSPDMESTLSDFSNVASQ